MAEPVGALRVDLSASSAQFEANMKKAKDAVQKNASGMSAAMGKVGKKFTEAATALNRYAGYAVAGAAVAMAAFVKQQIDIADKMGKLAQQTGTTSEFLSGMTLVASQAGTSLETVAKGIQRLSMNMNDMKRGVGESKETFELLNISVDNADGTLRNSEDVMKEIADKFSKMEDGADKTAAAMRIFGRAGAELIPMLNMGSAGIEDLQKKAKEMGLVIGTETALQAAYLNDQLDILIKSAQGTGRSLALNLIPWLNETLAVMKFAKEESGLLMAAWVGLGAIGDAIFGSSTQQKIKQTKKQLELLRTEGIPGLGDLGGIASQEIEKLEKELASLEAQKEREDKADKARMEASLKRYQEEADQRRKNTEELIRQQQARIDAQIKTKEAEKAANAEAKKAAEEKKQLEKEYADKQAEFQDAHKRATLSATEYELQQLKSLYDEYAAYIDDKTKLDEWYAAEKANILDKSVEKEKSNIDDLKAAIEGWGRDSADAIVKFARTGEMSFSDMIDSMIDDLLRMMIYQNITQPLFGAISGGLGSFFGGAAGGAASIPATTGPSVLAAKGNVFKGGNVIPFARGGIVDRPTIFPMARGAGLMGEAGAEAILPLTRIGGDLGVKAYGGGTEVNIYNNVGADVTTQERATADGSKAIDVYIDQAVAKKLGQFGSQSNKAIRQNFGASQRLTGR
jgi:hypothetical protein